MSKKINKAKLNIPTGYSRQSLGEAVLHQGLKKSNLKKILKCLDVFFPLNMKCPKNEYNIK